MDQESLAGRQFDGFNVEEELGRGGMGVVYLAEQVNLGRKVALKIIAPSLSDDSDFRVRFEREARAAASLDHPNVVPVFEAGAVEDRLYLSMRYVRGTDLSTVLATEGRLRPDTAADVTRQLGSALDAAHSTGLIHRDVKPGNVLISNFATEPHVYLSDFGLTKEASEASAGLTGSGDWVGTLDYVAPEQMDNRGIDARTDVYSLGCVLFQMLSGRVPYTGTGVQKMFGHANEPPPSLMEVDPALAQRFDHVVARAMAKDPAQRYPSAGDLGRAATAASAGASVTQPERSVASGAALGAVVTDLSTQPLDHSSAGTKADGAPPPWRPPTAATAPIHPQDHNRAPDPPKSPSRSRIVIPLVVVTVLALGLAAGALLAAQGGDDSGGEQIENTGGSGGGSGSGSGGEDKAKTDTPTTESAPPTQSVSSKSYTSSAGQWTAQIPTGEGWSEPVESQPNAGLFRTTIDGPEGLAVVVDFTPGEAPQFGGGATSQRQVSQPNFGTATEYVFSGGRITQCQGSTCVDYIIEDGQGGGYAVLAGGGTDFALAKQVGNKVMRTLNRN